VYVCVCVYVCDVGGCRVICGCVGVCVCVCVPVQGKKGKGNISTTRLHWYYTSLVNLSVATRVALLAENFSR
jgi:hypothetical protein